LFLLRHAARRLETSSAAESFCSCMLASRCVCRPAALRPGRCAARMTRALQSALGCRASRVWGSIIQFMNLRAIATTVSHVRRCSRPTASDRIIRASQVLLPSIDNAPDRDVQLGILQCASLTQHLLTSSLLLVALALRNISMRKT
jgi:hypothetical protein